MKYLPPLNYIRSFEAAARHLSFTKAAEELRMTQAAVSGHIRALEQFLGRPLLRCARSLLGANDNPGLPLGCDDETGLGCHHREAEDAHHQPCCFHISYICLH